MTSIADTISRVDAIGNEHQGALDGGPTGMQYLAARVGLDHRELAETALGHGIDLQRRFDIPGNRFEFVALLTAVWAEGFTMGMEHERSRDAAPSD